MQFNLRNIIPAILLAAPLLGVNAQELHENLTVKGEYDIDMVKTDRIYTLPQRINVAPPKFQLDYDLTGHIASYDTWYNPLVPLGYKDTHRFERRRGYLDVASGSMLNTTASAGYRFIDSNDFSLSAMLQHTSTSLFHPRLSLEADNIKRYIYDETIGVKADCNLSGVGTLSAEAYYRLAFFNYYGIVTPCYGSDRDKAPTQTLNDLTFRLSLLSAPDYAGNTPFGYSAAAGVRYFGYRAGYDFLNPLLERFKGSRETDVYISGGVARVLSPTAALGLDARLDLLFYGGGRVAAPDYGSVEATPYFRLSTGNLALKAGVNLAYTFDFNNDLDSYSAFHVAPDVRLDWKYRAFGLYLKAGGGVQLQTLAALSGLDYYQLPEAGKTQPRVTPLDARLGFTFGPWAGFSAGIYAGYATTRNVLAGGWYMATLAYGSALAPLFPADGTTPLPSESYMNIHGFHFGLDLSYEPASWIKASASAQWQRQNGTTGVFNGYDRPEWVVDAKLTARPLFSLRSRIAQSLALTVGYDYRGNRTIYTPATASDGAQSLLSMHLNDMARLSVGASIDVSSNVSIYAKGLNLLGCRAPELPMQAVERAGFLVGFDWKF